MESNTNKDMPTICFSHKDCFDGMAAAWVVSKRYPDAEFVFLDYDDPIDHLHLIGKRVIVVDFSFDLETTLQMVESSSEFIMLDHHERSREICKQVTEMVDEPPSLLEKDFKIICALHSAESSGCMMTWDYFFGYTGPTPPILRYIQDHDLWTHALPATRAVIAGLGRYAIDLDLWKRLLEEPTFVGDLIKVGTPLVQLQDTQINQVISLTMRMMHFDGYGDIPVVNCPRFMMSETLDRLAQDHPFAVGYYDTPTVRKFSLRSLKGIGVNVHEVAKLMGGSGHKHAAGANVPRFAELAKI